MSERKVWPELNDVNAPRDTERVTLRSDEIDWIIAVVNVELASLKMNAETRAKEEAEWITLKSKLTANRIK